jgi:hypothetical protein
MIELIRKPISSANTNGGEMSTSQFNLLNVDESTSNPSSDVVLVSTSSSVQYMTPSNDIAVTLPNFKKSFHIFNLSSTKIITIKASDASVIRTVYPLTDGRVIPISTSPATQASWLGVGTIVSSWLPYASGTGTNVRNAILDTGPTINLGTGGEAFCYAEYKRIGDGIMLRGNFAFGNTGAVAGSGNFFLKPPAGITLALSARYSDVAASLQMANNVGSISFGVGAPERVFGQLAIDMGLSTTLPFFQTAANTAGNYGFTNGRVITGAILASGNGSTLGWTSTIFATNEWTATKG